MIKRLIKDSTIYGISSIISQGIPILILPLYTRILLPNSYGCLDVLAVFASLINLTVALEISQGLARNYVDTTSEYEKNEIASTALWFTVGAYLLFACFSLLYSKQLTLIILDSAEWIYTFQISMIAIAGNGIYFFLQNFLRWKLEPLGYALSSILYALVSVGFGIVFVVFFRTDIVGVFYGQIIGSFIGSIFTWSLSRNIYKLTFSWSQCKKMLSFSLPLVPSSISVLVANYIDRIAIKLLMTLGDVGIYGVGFRLASIVNLTIVGFYSALTPLVYKNYQKGSTREELVKVFSYYLAATIPLLIIMVLFSKEILLIFTTPQYYGAWTTVPILAVSSIIAKMYIFTPGLDIAKKTTIIASINIGVALLNTILNLVLIPFWGINGAAAATLLSSSVMFVGYMFFNQKYYPIMYQWKKVFIAMMIAFVTIIFGDYFFKNIKSIFYINVLYKSIVLCIGSFFILLILTRKSKKRSI